MKTRYFKYYYYRKKFHVFRIFPDGRAEKYLLEKHGSKEGKWVEFEKGGLARLIEDKIEEISEEDYFLMCL